MNTLNGFGIMPIVTAKDVDNRNGWWISDELTHLREWGSDKTYSLPLGHGDYLIGAAQGLWLELFDPTGRVSRRHAKLTRSEDRWTLLDLNSSNGIHVDGDIRAGCILTPGVEVGIGGITLIAESRQWCELRALMQRLIGWDAERWKDVDSAMRVVRTAAMRRAATMLCGEGDMVQVARLLHRRTLGDERPFIVCDPKRQKGDVDARSAANRTDIAEAMADAVGGTLCLRHERLPKKFIDVVTAALQPESRVQLTICSHPLIKSGPVASLPIVLPSLWKRSHEIPRIVDAYAADAVAELGGELASSDREWILKHDAATLPAIELATRYLIALRHENGVVAHAARLLGRNSHGSLREWTQRRRPLPVFQTSKRGRHRLS